MSHPNTARKQTSSFVFSFCAPLLILALAFSGCAHRPSAPETAPGTPGAVGGPSTPSGDDSVGPLPSPDYTPPKEAVVLVLGPGLARGFAYLGVISELEERQMIISGIVGVEIGAMIGGIWASSNSNTLDWLMHKFKRQSLLDVPLLRFGRRSNLAEGKTVYKFLSDAIKVNELQKMKVPLVVASATREGDSTGGLLLESTGSSVDKIRGALSIPGILRTYGWEGRERMTAALESPFPADYARNLGLGRVVCVDVLGGGDNFKAQDRTEEELAVLMRSAARIAREQLKQCEVVLSVPTSGISPLNFESKADLIYQGRLAVRKWLESQ